MRTCVVSILVIAACKGESGRAKQKAYEDAKPVAADAPAAAAPLAFAEAFAVPFAVTVNELRAQVDVGDCRFTVTLDRSSSITKRPVIELGGHSTQVGASNGCQVETSVPAQLGPLTRAAVELAGLHGQPIALLAGVAGDRETLQRYLGVLASLGAEADEAALAKALFDRGVFASFEPAITALGYRLIGVELFRLEPSSSVVGLSEAELKAMTPPAIYPPRLPVRAVLVLEPKPGAPTGQRGSAPRTLAKLYALPFEAKLASVTLRADTAPCAPELELGHGTLAIAHDRGCALTDAQLTTELPVLFRAGAELLDATALAKWTMSTPFEVAPVLEKWIPATRTGAWKKQVKRGASDYPVLEQLMIEHRVFSHFDPLFGAIGLRLDRVGIEKVSTETGSALLARHPSLASTGLAATDKIRIPLMTWLVLVR